MFNFLSTSTQPKPSVDSGKKAPVRALPAAWYTTREMYEFERRAIFSRRWLFLTHSSRLQQPGDFLRYTVAGYDFVVLMDRTNKINAFHNVCRHRAYTVVEKDQGRAGILSCR
jgi:phenylpropionate dioxygenase-like ring-hydroxylating dioxygenase large terminal subunit